LSGVEINTPDVPRFGNASAAKFFCQSAADAFLRTEIPVPAGSVKSGEWC
jgi:hypothetical protein